MTGCFFCKEYNRLRDYYDLIESRGGTMHHEIAALIMTIGWNEISGRHHYGTMTHCPKPEGFALNYCPECGRRLTND